VGSHRGLCPAFALVWRKPPIGIDRVLEPRHEAASRRPGDLPPVVAGGARQPTDPGHLTTDDGIARRHGSGGPDWEA